MKSAVIGEPEEKREITYPCLMKSIECNVIVLFNNTTEGTIVYSKDKADIGVFSKDINPNFFEWLPEGKEVVLSNKKEPE